MIQRDTKVIVVETNPFDEISRVWVGYQTVGEVIDYVYTQSKNAPWQYAPWLGLSTPQEFVCYLAGKTDSSFESTKAYQEWLDSRTTEDIFNACIECTKQAGYLISVHFSKTQAEEEPPKYMSAEGYAAALEQYQNEI